jgi:hypothetical protein
MAGNTVHECQELPQKRFLCPSESRHIGTALTTAQHGAEGNDQDFVQLVPGIGFTRVFELGETGIEPVHGTSKENPTLRINPAAHRKSYFRRLMSYAIPLPQPAHSMVFHSALGHGACRTARDRAARPSNRQGFGSTWAMVSIAVTF